MKIFYDVKGGVALFRGLRKVRPLVKREIGVLGKSGVRLTGTLRLANHNESKRFA